MNDADRRRSPDGFDDDAIFADIVAHLNDEATEAEQADRPPAGDAPSDIATADQATDETNPEPGTLPPRVNPPGESPRAHPVHWSINPPPGPPAPINPPPGPPAPMDPPVDPAPQVWRAHEVDGEYEEHFEPPPVTPLPAGDLQFWAIIAGMTCGPLLLLYLVFFNRDAGSYWILTAIAMSVGGFAMLVSRMPGQHDEDDDGARL